MAKSKIKIGIIGVGNCASSLIQGIHFYKDKSSVPGLMHVDIGGFSPSDIEVVLAFDIDKRKVGKDLREAIFSEPNCTKIFCKDIPPLGLKVKRGITLDGYSAHMESYSEAERFIKSDEAEPTQGDVIDSLKASGTEVLINFLPVGSEAATKFYVECALGAKVAFVNCIPVFIASDFHWANKFKECNVPLFGDDIKSQCGATIVHRVLADLFMKRGVMLERTYQLNTGGNTDFLNMVNQSRLKDKKKSKTEAVQSVLKKRLKGKDIHIGPSDYVSWQKDNKVCFIRMEGKGFGNLAMNLELRLSVEDSPNSAGVVIDAIRCAKLALLRGEGGVIDAPSAYFMKHPRRQLSDDEAYLLTERFIKN